MLSCFQPLSDASHAPVLPKQGVGTTTAIADNDGILVSNDGPRAIDSQIADLTRQHAEAQRRLQNILEQQKRQRSQLKDDGGEGGPSHLEQRDHVSALPFGVSIIDQLTFVDIFSVYLRCVLIDFNPREVLPVCVNFLSLVCQILMFCGFFRCVLCIQYTTPLSSFLSLHNIFDI